MIQVVLDALRMTYQELFVYKAKLLFSNILQFVAECEGEMLYDSFDKSFKLRYFFYQWNLLIPWKRST